MQRTFVALTRKSTKSFYRNSKYRFASPVTGKVLPLPIIQQIQQQADPHQARNRYWVTLTQMYRSFGTYVKPHQKPLMVLPGSTNVVPLEDLTEESRKPLLDRYPPYFSSGVGLFTDGKWKVVKMKAVVKQLNPDEETRKLFVDEHAVNNMGLQLTPNAKPIVIDDVAKIALYAAGQALRPRNVHPRNGIAINPGNGRQFAQPAHRRLVIASIMLGYCCPYWLTEKQATKMFDVNIVNKNRGVEVSLRDGVAVPLSSLPDGIRNNVMRTKPPPAQEYRQGAMMLLDCDAWEPVLNPAVSTAMIKSIRVGSNHTDLWVTTRRLSLHLNPTDAAVSSSGNDAAASAASTTASLVQHKSVILGLPPLPFDVSKCPQVDLAEKTKTILYNAENTDDPMMVFPRERALAIVNGRRVDLKLMDDIIDATTRRKFLSPVWLTERDAQRLGVGILDKEKPVTLKEKALPDTRVFNMDCIENPEPFLRRNPPPTEGHAIFLINWRPVTSELRRVQMESYGFKSKLWVMPAEISLSNLKLKEGASATVLSSKASKGAGHAAKKIASSSSSSSNEEEVGRRVWNAQQTTDPVRVLALSKFFMTK